MARKEMKKLLFGLLAGFGSSASLLCLTAARHQETIRPNTKVGPVQVGGLTPDEARRQLRVWWEGEKLNKLKLSLPGRSKRLPEMKPGDLGLTLDDDASVQGLPLTSFLGDAKATITQESYPVDVRPIVLRPNGVAPEALRRAVKAALGPDRPARVRYEKGKIVREPEVAGEAVDESGLSSRVAKAILGDHKIELPMTSGPKRVTDDALKEIVETVAEFSTRFSASNRPRASNIKVAASKIDGWVLMPGERFSFNDVVGRRTLKTGFKLAGVYINGQHDTGIGGGICQVSTTLYNSALLSNLPIKSRSNHSLPVPYVPLGRDATVDYGNLDLAFVNPYPTPIALAAHYQPGKLTFRILGKKQPGLSIKITQSNLKSSPVATKRVLDPKLAAGRTRVVSRGGAMRSVQTFRWIFQDGKLVKKERLGTSRYGAEPRVIAVGTRPVSRPTPKVPTAPPPTATPVPPAPAPEVIPDQGQL